MYSVKCFRRRRLQSRRYLNTKYSVVVWPQWLDWQEVITVKHQRKPYHLVEDSFAILNVFRHSRYSSIGDIISACHYSADNVLSSLARPSAFLPSSYWADSNDKCFIIKRDSRHWIHWRRHQPPSASTSGRKSPLNDWQSMPVSWCVSAEVMGWRAFACNLFSMSPVFPLLPLSGRQWCVSDRNMAVSHHDVTIAATLCRSLMILWLADDGDKSRITPATFYQEWFAEVAFHCERPATVTAFHI